MFIYLFYGFLFLNITWETMAESMISSAAGKALRSCMMDHCSEQRIQYKRDFHKEFPLSANICHKAKQDLCEELFQENLGDQGVQRLLKNITHYSNMEDLETKVALQLRKITPSTRPAGSLSPQKYMGNKLLALENEKLLQPSTAGHTREATHESRGNRAELHVRKLIAHACMFSFCEYPRLLRMYNHSSRSEYTKCAKLRCPISYSMVEKKFHVYFIIIRALALQNELLGPLKYGYADSIQERLDIEPEETLKSHKESDETNSEEESEENDKINEKSSEKLDNEEEKSIKSKNDTSSLNETDDFDPELAGLSLL